MLQSCQQGQRQIRSKPVLKNADTQTPTHSDTQTQFWRSNSTEVVNNMSSDEYISAFTTSVISTPESGLTSFRAKILLYPCNEILAFIDTYKIRFQVWIHVLHPFYFSSFLAGFFLGKSWWKFWRILLFCVGEACLHSFPNIDPWGTLVVIISRFLFNFVFLGYLWELRSISNDCLLFPSPIFFCVFLLCQYASSKSHYTMLF